MSAGNPTPGRVERDLLGEYRLPKDALYGIHTARFNDAFTIGERPVRRELVRAYGLVKWACARCNGQLGYLAPPIADAIVRAAREMATVGPLAAEITVDALQGGAGTATNMNVNEVLANRALQLIGRAPGDYDTISPLAHVNLHQSTNDTYPTAMRVAALTLLEALEQALVELVAAFQRQEHRLAQIVKVGRTQLCDALLTTLGREMGCYAEAFGRDRWRLFKCKERLRGVNLGGTAIGSGFGAPRDYIFSVVDVLREVCGLNVNRTENLMDGTQNLDVLVEVMGMLKACATNLIKVSSDLRLLNSGPDAGFGEIRLPAMAAGSSMMPSKVNPTVPEAVISAALAVIGNEQALSTAVAMGNLELNAFSPLIADRLLESLALLNRACRTLSSHAVAGLEANASRCSAHVEGSAATLTALVQLLGHEGTEAIARQCREQGISVRQALLNSERLSEAEYEAAVSASRVTRLGLWSADNPGELGDKA